MVNFNLPSYLTDLTWRAGQEYFNFNMYDIFYLDKQNICVAKTITSFLCLFVHFRRYNNLYYHYRPKTKFGARQNFQKRLSFCSQEGEGPAYGRGGYLPPKGVSMGVYI